MATAKAVAVYALALSVALITVQWTMVPRSLGILQPLIFLILVGTSRAMARFWLAGMGGTSEESARRLLIFGAGTAGVQTAVALAVSRQFTLVGFVDDDPAKCGRSINGVPVWPASVVAERIARQGVTDILLAIPGATRERRKAIVDSLKALPVHVRTLPSMQDLASGRVQVQDFRELDIEDLLGRDPVPPRADLLVQDIAGQVVMVTGAGGSIGSELSRQIFAQRPQTLVLLDHSEFALYSIHQELLALRLGALADIALVPVLARVSDSAHMKALCLHHRPATVYHAAAYKHVPLVEFNPGQGVLNNVFGTLSVAAAALEAQVGRFVLISTDKAVRPTNIMGASKRMAELVLQALAQRHSDPGSTCFSMVRFGNVLGSSGSVVPFFRQQLAAGGPLTVTHPEVTRYFMTITEAAQLVLQAGAMGQGGDVFVLDMGEPVKILDLAHRMVQLAGLSVRDAAHPSGDIEIAITGLRPGEKLYEELLIGDNPQSTLHPRIMKAHEDMLPWDVLQDHLSALRAAAVAEDDFQIRAVLAACVQGFSALQAAPVASP
jgi:FlaA1/EpsC-like NDP-sugar epimerase